MMPILALVALFFTLPLQAQQLLPLPPRDLTPPKEVQATAIPQQSASELKALAATAPAAKSATENKDKLVRLEDNKAIKQVVLSKEDELKRLAGLPFFNLQTNKAPLADVMMLLADTCQMSYVGLEKGVGENVQISVNISKNPYEIMKLLCERYNVALDYERGIWRFALYNDNELIARVYHLRYNNLEEVSSSGGGGGSSGGSSSSSSSGGSTASSNVGGSASASFSVKKDIIVKDIETFMGFTSKDPSILTAEDYDVNDVTQVLTRGIQRVLPTMGEDAAASDAKGKVLYNSDNRTLYVLATRAQHQWIEKYISIVDKPQKQIVVETKIYETGLNPQRLLGVDWTASGARSKNLSGNAFTGFASNQAPNFTAILNVSDFQATLTMLDSDASTSSVQYPRQVTISNRPVAMASVQQVPIKQSQTSTDTSVGSGGTQEQTTITYINVGTNISVLPRIIDENKVQMDISVTVSTIITYDEIENNKYPVVAQRDYKTQAIVESGYTLAIGGLKEVSNSDTYSGLPVLSKVPVMGALFRNRSKTHKDTNLMIFISPTILSEYRGGVKSEPQFVLPRDKDYPERRIFQGTADESYTDIMLALGGMDREILLYAQQSKEQTSPKALMGKISERQNELKLMQVRLQEIALQQPEKDVSQAAQQIEQYLNDLNDLRSSINQRRSLLR